MLVSNSMPRHATAFNGYNQGASAFAHHPRTVCVAVNNRHSPSIDDWSLCQVSYTSSTSQHSRKMPAAARSAFKALERDSNAAIARSKVASHATTAAAEAQSAIDTLCLVTYSEDDDAAASWQQQQQQLQLQQHVQKFFASTASAAAAAAASVQSSHDKASAIFAALCSEDHTDESDNEVVGVMETLCMVSYDEEAA